jgi:hypothetical protein
MRKCRMRDKHQHVIIDSVCAGVRVCVAVSLRESVWMGREREKRKGIHKNRIQKRKIRNEAK